MVDIYNLFLININLILSRTDSIEWFFFSSTK